MPKNTILHYFGRTPKTRTAQTAAQRAQDTTHEAEAGVQGRARQVAAEEDTGPQARRGATHKDRYEQRPSGFIVVVAP